jgi:hypothetical protein
MNIGLFRVEKGRRGSLFLHSNLDILDVPRDAVTIQDEGVVLIERMQSPQGPFYFP